MYMIKNIQAPDFYMFSSELKGIPTSVLQDTTYTVTEMPIGSYWSFNNSIVNRSESEYITYFDWNAFKSLDTCTITTPTPDILSEVYQSIQNYLIQAVVKRFKLSQTSVGVLLSGGFDSSIICSILVNYLFSVNHDFEQFPLHIFTIGDCKNNQDIQNAEYVVEFLERLYNIDLHHHIIYVNNTTISAQLEKKIDDIIYMVETFDNSCLREAIIFSYIFDHISTNTDVKVLLMGEGLDELCGYSQLFNGTDAQFQSKSVDLVQTYSKYFVRCTEKLAGSFGLELRYPYLDQSFLEYMLSIHPRLKRPQIFDHNMEAIDKYIVRKAFDAKDFPNSIMYLPDDILWRTSSRVADGYLHFCDVFDSYFNNKYSDLEFNEYIQRMQLTNQLVPKTKEQMHYKRMFDNYFPNTSVINKYWQDILN